MAVVSLKAEERTPDRKGGARRLRRDGRVPAVMYGIGVDPVPLSLDENEIEVMLRKYGGSSIILDLQIGEQPVGENRALVKEIQRHTVSGRVLHIDLLRVSATRKLTVEVPILLRGESKGVKEGGVMEVILREVRVQCLPADIPDMVEVDVSDMGIGDAYHVRDLNIPNAEMLTEDDNVVVTVVPPTVYEEPVEAAPEGEEPELVAEEKEKEEEAAEETEEGKEKGKEKKQE